MVIANKLKILAMFRPSRDKFIDRFNFCGLFYFNCISADLKGYPEIQSNNLNPIYCLSILSIMLSSRLIRCNLICNSEFLIGTCLLMNQRKANPACLLCG
jgi:hypothetical protein